MADTLQVDGLARIPGLTQAPYKTHPQLPKDIPLRLIKYVAAGTLIILVDRNYELPANKINKAKLRKAKGNQVEEYTQPSKRMQRVRHRCRWRPNY